MEHYEGYFTGVGGLQLYYQCWRPEGQVRAALAIIHGLGEHGGRYGNVVDKLVPLGFAVYADDHRGHGRSPGKRGHINAWSEFRGDVDAYLALVREQEPGRPLFLLGHSMGGLITLEYVLHHPEGLQGVVVSAPGLTNQGLSPLMILISRLLSRVWPSLSVPTGLEAAGISRDPAVVQAYLDDPLVHDRGTPRAGAEGFAAIEWTLAHAAEWPVPLLILHGTGDRLVPAAASVAFFEQVPIQDKQRIEYPGGYHESHNDIHHEQATADLAAWLDAHLS
jgi:alpha-beta hydrolase superfamily lysophospholipase